MDVKIYRVRVLDVKYQAAIEHLSFQYLTYEVAASNEEKAVKKARSLYMKGQKELTCEELPFLLKMFAVSERI
jgi:hypothetical protein